MCHKPRSLKLPHAALAVALFFTQDWKMSNYLRWLYIFGYNY